jgi:hypothetical protein
MTSVGVFQFLMKSTGLCFSYPFGFSHGVPAVLPFREPELFGGEVGEALVQVAVMRDEALEAVGPVAGDPV